MADSVTPDTLCASLQRITDHVQTKLLDATLEADLNRTFPPHGDVYRQILETCRAAIAAGDGKQFFHVVDIEIRHAPAEDLAVALQALEGADGFGERHASPPMQEIQVEAIGAKPRKASLACGDGALRSGILRIDLADQEHFVAPAVDGIGDDLLGTAFGIHLGGIDQRHAEVQPELQRGHFRLALARSLAHFPCAEPEGRHVEAVGQLHFRQR